MSYRRPSSIKRIVVRSASEFGLGEVNQDKDKQTSRRSHDSRRGFSLPNWLDSHTIALVTVALTLGAMIQTGHARLWEEISRFRQDVREDMTILHQDIDKVRVELSSDIQGLDARLRTVEVDLAAVRERLSAVEVDVSAIRTAMTGFDARLRAVESHTHDDVHWENPTQRDG